MRDTTAIVKNIAALMDAFDAVENRDAGVEGMVLVYGATGAGKTRALAYLMNRTNAIYVEASPAWSLTGMLRSIVRACGIEPTGRASDMEQQIITEMMFQQRPLFIDELDHLLLPGQGTTLRMLEALRSIYDKSRQPVVMVGMDKVDRHIKTRQQLARRVFQWVPFADLDREDARTVADACCEVEILDDLLDHLLTASGGRMGRLILGLAQIERRAKANRLSAIGLEHWGDRRFNLGI